LALGDRIDPASDELARFIGPRPCFSQTDAQQRPEPELPALSIVGKIKNPIARIAFRYQPKAAAVAELLGFTGRD